LSGGGHLYPYTTLSQSSATALIAVSLMSYADSGENKLFQKIRPGAESKEESHFLLNIHPIFATY
jgi:hypothetical protein